MRAGQLAVLALAVAAISTGAPFLRLASDAPALSKAMWRLALSVLILAPLCASRAPWRSGFLALIREDGPRVLASGLALALHFALWVPSLDYTSVASSVILVTLSPLFVGLLSPVALQERVPSGVWLGVALAVGGGVTIAWGDASFGPRALFGDALALGGAIAVSVYLIVGRSLRNRVALVPYITAVYAVAAAALWAVAAASGQELGGYERSTWWFLLALALGPQLLGHGGFNWALAGLSATFVAAATLGEPIGSTLLAWWWLGEIPPPRTLLGGLLVFAGLLTAARAEARSRAVQRWLRSAPPRPSP